MTRSIATRWFQRLAATSMALVAMAAYSSAADQVLGSPTQGTPKLQAVQALSFAPGGVLLVGDGAGGQVLAIATNDNGSPSAEFAPVRNLPAELAARLGTTADNVELVDMVVHPTSGRAYLAVARKDLKQPVILTLDGAGNIEEFSLTEVTYARVELPQQAGGPLRVTDVAWAGDTLIAAAAANEEFGSKLFLSPGPLVDGAQGRLFSAETYHVAHGRWETKAPMSTIMPLVEDGRTYVVGAFACTPVVKYPLDSLSPGANVRGSSVIELGSGNRPLDMFVYERDGRSFVLASTFRFHHDRRPMGPSPYWTVRFEYDLLGEEDKINELALRRITSDYQPATDRIEIVESFHGVMQMDQLNDTHALVVRQQANGQVDLEAVALP